MSKTILPLDPIKDRELIELTNQYNSLQFSVNVIATQINLRAQAINEITKKKYNRPAELVSVDLDRMEITLTAKPPIIERC